MKRLKWIYYYLYFVRWTFRDFVRWGCVFKAKPPKGNLNHRAKEYANAVVSDNTQ